MNPALLSACALEVPAGLILHLGGRKVRGGEVRVSWVFLICQFLEPQAQGPHS